jgi:hypothetical protein
LTQVSLFSAGALAVRISVWTLHRRELILFLTSMALLISLALGWEYWSDMGSNNALIVIAVFSATIAIAYFASGWYFLRSSGSRR